MVSTGSRPPTYYAEYLDLSTLLAAQHPLTDHPDELHFIVVHQVHELWFRLALHHLERARRALLEEVVLEAVRLLEQVTGIFRSTLAAIEHLQSLPPASFHVFRAMLSPASGMQSYQFREIEVLAGRRDERYLKWARSTLAEDSHRALLDARLAEPSLLEAAEGLLTRRGMPDIAAIYAAGMAGQPDLYVLCEALSALDHAIAAWRQAHILLIERTIGERTTGTGGTSHDYLQAMAQVRLFPALWEARNELSRRIDAGGGNR